MESVGEQQSEGRILFGERHGSKDVSGNSKRREELQIGISCRDPTEGYTERYSLPNRKKSSTFGRNTRRSVKGIEAD